MSAGFSPPLTSGIGEQAIGCLPPKSGRQTFLRSDLAWWLSLLTLCAVLAAPLFVIDVPPLLDYPNHLARLFVLARLPADPVLARFYAPAWAIIPNLGLDIIGAPLIAVLPVHVAGRLLIAIAVLLPVLGVVAYHSALGGRWWSLGVGLVAYNNCQLYGFLNFEMSLGLGFILAACWLRWRECRPGRAILTAVVGAPLLFVCHLMGLILFAALVGSTELFRVYDNARRGGLIDVARAAAKRAFILAGVLFVPALLYATSALEQLQGDALFSLTDKVGHFLAVFVNYDVRLDLTTAALAIGLPSVALILHRARVPGPAAIAICLLTVTYVVTPYYWKGTSGLDMRFAVMLGFMVFAGFVPRAMPPWATCSAAAVLGIAFLARMALLTHVWAAHATELTALRTVLSPVKPGQTIYVATIDAGTMPAYWAKNPGWRRLANDVRTDNHLAALALIEHRAFWQGEFDFPSQQPLATREPFATLAHNARVRRSRDEMIHADLCGFDYLLQTEADAFPALPQKRFQLLGQAGFVALYAITRCAAPATAPSGTTGAAGS